MARHKIIWMDAGWLPYHYAFCPTERAWNHYAKQTRTPLGSYLADGRKAETSLFRQRKTKRPVAIVTVGGDLAPNVTADLLVHEAMHVWRDIRESLGEKEPSSEFEAYAMQNITANLFEAYEKTRGRLFIRPRPLIRRKRPGGRGNGRFLS